MFFFIFLFKIWILTSFICILWTNIYYIFFFISCHYFNLSFKLKLGIVAMLISFCFNIFHLFIDEFELFFWLICTYVHFVWRFFLCTNKIKENRAFQKKENRTKFKRKFETHLIIGYFWLIKLHYRFKCCSFRGKTLHCLDIVNK